MNTVLNLKMGIVTVIAMYLGKEKKIQLPLLSMEDDYPENDRDSGLAVAEQKPELKSPPMYKVVLLNDDYTPMEFVVEILEAFFYMNREQATQVMLTVHTHGKGIGGVFTRDVAETKAAQVNQYSRDNEHPLLAEVEVSDDSDED